MKRLILAGFALAACGPSQPPEQYGFVAQLGRDTVSVERVTRRGNTLTSDAVDRFPRVRQRHTEIVLRPDGGIRRLITDIVTPSESEDQRERRVTVDVTDDSVHIVKRDRTGTLRRDFATGGSIAMAHLPQMYSLYELYFAAALRHANASSITAGQPVRMRQFYIDREFDNFPLHRGVVRRMPDGIVEIQHDWLSGTGEATLDSAHRLLSYSGSRSTYKVQVTRLNEQPDVKAIAARFAERETRSGGMKSLSVRDTAQATVGNASFTVDYSRPLARGRQLIGGIVPHDQVWRTGANAATQFTTTAPITLGGLRLAPATYTLWTVPRTSGVELIVNKQTGQWGTGYNRAFDLGRAKLVVDSLATPVEAFTISVLPADARRGTLVMEWGSFRWTAPIVVQ